MVEIQETNARARWRGIHNELIRQTENIRRFLEDFNVNAGPPYCYWKLFNIGLKIPRNDDSGEWIVGLRYGPVVFAWDYLLDEMKKTDSEKPSFATMGWINQ